MELKNEIYDKLCFIKNNKYNLSSRKLSNIDILLFNNILISTSFLDKYDPQLSCRVKYIFYDMNMINKCNNCRKGVCDECDKECEESYKKCYKCAFT